MIGDVDLWQLSEDGIKLQVNSKWLQHLQVGAGCLLCILPLLLLRG